MIQSSLFQNISPIYTGSRTVVCRAERVENGQPVIVKALRSSHPNFRELVQFRNQFVISDNLDSPYVVRPLGLKRHDNGYLLVMPDQGAISIQQYWTERFQHVPPETNGETAAIALTPTNLKQFFDIAIQLAKALHYLSTERVVHKDIKPANILIHPETGQIQLIDFSISSLLPKEQQQPVNPAGLEGTLAYIAPEQTGRMNRGIDYRTDFYSLGVTLYELLTGQLPFISNDPLELLHCHIAQDPIAPVDLQKNGQSYAPMLSAIIMKLMAKNAEERYQSALGLQHDLERCWRSLETTGHIEEFELGERDVCDRFLIPEKLYGREAEVKALLTAFDRVSQGKSEMILVAGFSGIGKTAVINEIHKPIIRQRGYFIKGKFDQFNRNIPFSAFVQAFRDLISQLLSESDEDLLHWKAQILEAVGDNGQVLIDVIPELEKLLGQQPSATELSGTAAQNRFNLLFQKFIALFATLDHPLVMFLDDLQWADSASLNLMKVLMGESERGYLLLLGAYRDNEVFPAHPLMLTLADLDKQNAEISTITLEALSQNNINQLVAETLSCPVTVAEPLTELVYRKAQGNPFFTTQFLKGLYEDDLITFDRNLGYWQCDLVQVQDAALTDDVVAFMAGRLRKLPQATQDVLRLAACIGNRFDLETLAVVQEISLEELASTLWAALKEGFILPRSAAYKFFQGELDVATDEKTTINYRFLHDRIQQAAYSLIPEDEKQQTHLTIGRLLLENTSEENLDDKIFDIVNHLNIGLNLIISDEEKQHLCTLNFQAGCKAKNSTAYGAALEYLLQGIELLANNSWNRQYKLTLRLYESATESAYLNGEFEQMEQLGEVGLKNAQTLLDTIKFYEIKIQAFEARTRFEEALDTAMVILGKLGIRPFPSKPDASHVERWLSEVKTTLGDRNPNDLSNLPDMTDLKVLAAMRILSSVVTAAYKAQPTLMVLMTFEAVMLSMRYGNAPDSAFAYSLQGLVLCSSNDVELGYQFGKLASQLLLKSNTVAVARTLQAIYGHINHYKEPLRNSIAGIKDVYSVGLETGDLEYAGYGLACYSFYSYLSGKELSELVQEMSANSVALKRIKKTTPQQWNDMYGQMVENLLGRTQNPCLIVGKCFDEETVMPLRKQANDLTTQAYFYVSRAFICYLFQDLKGASESIEQAGKSLKGASATPLEPLFYFYQSLVILAQFPLLSESKDQGLLQNVIANQTVVKTLAEYSPANYHHKWHLIEAERYRVLGKKVEAIESYDQAIAGAKANGYIQEEALANELAAKFYLDWGKEKFAAVHMQEAYYCYARWGAKAKTDHLEVNYPGLLTPILQKQQGEFNPLDSLDTLTKTLTATLQIQTQSSTNISEALDFAAILQAAQKLSSTIDLKELLGDITQLILTNAGAQKMALLIPNGNQWHIQTYSEQTKNGKIVTRTVAQPLATSSSIPVRLIQYVKNTQEPVLVSEAETEIPGILEGYLLKHQPQSVFCVPLLNQGNLVAITYLEHPTTKGVFTRNRQTIIEFLCAQAASALQNAQLYGQAQTAVTELQQAQLQLVQSEKMSALGNLVSGVAHEINNPVSFLHGNIKPAQDYVQDLFGLIELFQDKMPNPDEDIEEEIDTIDLEFIREDLPKLLNSMNLGVDRIRNISDSLRTFSRKDQEHKTAFNLHDGLESTLLILKHRTKANEYRPKVTILKEYGELPEVQCFPGQLNQVFMNILANAIDAFDDANKGKTFAEIEAAPNVIIIQTSCTDTQVAIQIKDNGCGMKPETVGRIFEQGFTTKEVGKGTGLGMAIAHQIITEKHRGQIICTSKLRQGTTFEITLPL